VIHVDTSVSPATARVIVIGGGVSGAPTARSPQTAERIGLTALTPTPAWSRTADMNFPRVNVNAVLLPDGNVLVIGGQRAGKWNADPQPVLEPELYDPRTNTWTVLPPMQHPRQYHSINPDDCRAWRSQLKRMDDDFNYWGRTYGRRYGAGRVPGLDARTGEPQMEEDLEDELEAEDERGFEEEDALEETDASFVNAAG
jgi:hypothetical protein